MGTAGRGCTNAAGVAKVGAVDFGRDATGMAVKMGVVVNRWSAGLGSRNVGSPGAPVFSGSDRLGVGIVFVVDVIDSGELLIELILCILDMARVDDLGAQGVEHIIDDGVCIITCELTVASEVRQGTEVADPVFGSAAVALRGVTATATATSSIGWDVREAA